jgi:hypothetical protein
MRAALRDPVLVISLLCSACASAGAGGASDRNRITQEQLTSTTAQNAYEVVRLLQPQWLDTRGPTSVTEPTPATATVYIDGSRAGDLDYLRTVNINTLAEIRYWPPGEASARFGMGHLRGVIELISKGTRR